MISFYFVNVDSNYGCRFQTYELAWEFERRVDGDQMNVFNSYLVYLFDRGGNSTSYPSIIPSMYDILLFTTDLESNAW